MARVSLLRIAELLRRGEGARRAWSAPPPGRWQEPCWRACASSLEAERAAGLPATWFVLCGTPTPASWLRGDLTYTPESDSNRRLLDEIMQAGHEIGLHGSFATTLDADRLRDERERLGRLIGGLPIGVRQHFLRMRPGQTQAAMRAAGFQYDATYGFPDRNGLRLGVADSVPAWFSDGAPLLETVPLVWMDRALSKYRGVEDPKAWIADALSLAATCREAEGLWVGLWHPNLIAALGFPGAPEPAAIAASWPLTRRIGNVGPDRRLAPCPAGVRVRRFAPGGTPDLVTAAASDWPVSVEDEQGRVVAPGVRPERHG
jgi:hypothetical protein